MDTHEALLTALEDHNFFEPVGADCTDAKTFAQTIAECADRSMDNTETVFNKMALTIQFAAKRMIDTAEHSAIGTREALEMMFARLEQTAGPVFGSDASKIVDQIAEIVLSRVGEMPMPGESAAVVKGLADSIKAAGLELTKQNSYSR